ncbi:hypothetical protein K8I61_03150 [bacterium]|nr:hypothetical protein [bacterium]
MDVQAKTTTGPVHRFAWEQTDAEGKKKGSFATTVLLFLLAYVSTVVGCAVITIESW